MDRTFEHPPHVLDRVEIQRVGGEINDLNSMLLQEFSCCSSCVLARCPVEIDLQAYSYAGALPAELCDSSIRCSRCVEHQDLSP